MFSLIEIGDFLSRIKDTLQALYEFSLLESFLFLSAFIQVSPRGVSGSSSSKKFRGGSNDLGESSRILLNVFSNPSLTDCLISLYVGPIVVLLSR